MAPLTMTFSDPEGDFCCLKPFYLTYLGKYSGYYLRYAIQMNRNVQWLVISTIFNFENERLLKVTTSHVRCK